MDSYALLIGSALSAGTVLAIAALGLLINTAEKIMPTGCSRPTKATMMAAKP